MVTMVYSHNKQKDSTKGAVFQLVLKHCVTVGQVKKTNYEHRFYLLLKTCPLKLILSDKLSTSCVVAG